MSAESQLLASVVRGPTLIVAAHPDDESIGLGAHLHLLPEVHIVVATDGATRDRPERAIYAGTRRSEFERAVKLAGIGPETLHYLGAVDQELALSFGNWAENLAEQLRHIRPAFIFTHAYEGGHPDHDSCSFLVRLAVELTALPCSIWEFASYHNGSPMEDPPQLTVGQFLPPPVAGTLAISLSEELRERKRSLIECYSTQADFLQNFPLDTERFRPRPHYNYLSSPHEGRLFYETQGWGLSPQDWRERVQSTLQQFALNTLG